MTDKPSVRFKLHDLADPSCKKCYGRGITGYNERTRQYLVCQCVIKTGTRLACEELGKGNVRETVSAAPPGSGDSPDVGSHPGSASEDVRTPLQPEPSDSLASEESGHHSHL